MQIDSRATCSVVAICLVAGLACSSPSSSSSSSSGTGSGSAAASADKPKLRLSMIPTTDPGKMARESEPLIAYLKAKTGAEVELTVPLNYAAVVEAFGADKVDIAYFGGFTYVQARKRFDAIPLVQRDIDQEFHSLFIVPSDSTIKTLADLAGKQFAFGDVNSTSGHLMPSYFMRQAAVDPQVLANAKYTGGHDATALAVVNKQVDAGALDETVFHKLTRDGKLDAAKLTVFYTTPPYFDYVWAARKGLDPALAEAFAQAMLALSADDVQHKPILDVLRGTRYVRATDASYDKLREAASAAGLLR